MIKTLIFDFDGTIADTFDTAIRRVNEIAIEMGLVEKVLSDEEIVKYRGMTINQILDSLNVPIAKLPALLVKYKKRVNENIHEEEVFDGQTELLNEFNKKFKLIILTSNSKENVEKFLEHNHLTGIFDEIYSEKNYLGKGRALKKVIKKGDLEIEESIYIGDEVRDIEACKSIGLKIISVTWGFNSKELIQQYQPDFMVDSVSEFRDLLKTLTS